MKKTEGRKSRDTAPLKALRTGFFALIHIVKNYFAIQKNTIDLDNMNRMYEYVYIDHNQ
jgi:hypothetical protein